MMDTKLKKYYCKGGWVYSSDGDEHYIPSSRLPYLYHVPLNECHVARDHVDICPNDAFILRTCPNIIELYPRNDGNYSIPLDK